MVEGRHVSRPRRLRLLPVQRARLRARGREAAAAARCRARRPGCGWRSASWCGSTRTSSTSAPPRSRSGRSRCSGTASASATSCSTSSRWSPGRACTRATSRSAASPRTSRPGFYDEARKFCERMPKAVDEYEAILNSNKIWLERTVGVGAALGRGRDRARADGAEPARLRRRLGPAQARAVPRLRPGRLRRARLRRRRRLRPLQGARRRDARVDADHRAVHRPARADAGRAVDRGRPQGRAAAARGAAHLDGVADPPLQDRHRGLPRPRGRGLRRRSSRRAASSAATSSPTAAAKPWRVKFRAPSFAALHATAACCQDVAVADLIASSARSTR